jgi:hypothetical protein
MAKSVREVRRVKAQSRRIPEERKQGAELNSSY